MQLFRPTPEMKEAFLDYIGDWIEHGERVAPGAARMDGRTYEAWLLDTWRMETQPLGEYVPAHTLFSFDSQGMLVGVISIRHTLNDYLLRVGGHIGYGVRPSARRRGYASAMLAAALPVARELGLTRVMVSCNKENLGSARTIEKNGGVLENEVYDESQIVRRYWITLQKAAKPLTGGRVWSFCWQPR